MPVTFPEKDMCVKCLANGVETEMPPIDATAETQDRVCTVCGGHLYFRAYEYNKTPDEE